MRTVDEKGVEVSEPDLEIGYVTVETIVAVHHDAVEAVPEETELVEVWVDPDNPSNKLYDRVVIRKAEPAREAYDELERVKLYRLYSAEQLEERERRRKEEAEAAERAEQEAAAAAAAAAEKAEFEAALPDALMELAAMAADNAAAQDATESRIDEIYDAIAELGSMVG